MQEMTLTFEWTDHGCRGRVIANRQFAIKDESRIREDVGAWVREMYEADGGKHEHFEVCRLHGAERNAAWLCYGTKDEFNWCPDFMSFALLTLCVTLNYLGWERDMSHVKGYHFVNVSNGDHMRCGSLEEIDRFIQSEMRRTSDED